MPRVTELEQQPPPRAATAADRVRTSISLVLPMFNESPCVDVTLARAVDQLGRQFADFEIVALERDTMTGLVTVDAKATAVGQSDAGIRAGDTMTVASLLQAMLVRSANEAAMAMFERFGSAEAAPGGVREVRRPVDCPACKRLHSFGAPRRQPQRRGARPRRPGRRSSHPRPRRHRRPRHRPRVSR